VKRYGNLYEKIFNIENLVLAHRNARKGKTHYTDVIKVDANPELYLTEIHKMLKNKTYHTSEYKTFIKHDGKKDREIFVLPYYPDRIIQWAIVQVLEPIWEGTLIANTFSSLKGRGIHQGLGKLQKDLKNWKDTKYCLKIDIKKFYPSIDHVILKSILRKKIKDVDALELLDGVIDGAPGVPIGNYLSQYFGNLYLSGFDHWCKEQNRMKYYYRYCDDVVILHSDKLVLRTLVRKIKEYLAENLFLVLKSNWQVFPTVVRGVDFLGYRCFGTYTLLRKSIVQRMVPKFKQMLQFDAITRHDMNVISSYHGWLSWCDSYRLGEKYITPLLNKEVIL
jgi:RNA-directed DNA polymerase